MAAPLRPASRLRLIVSAALLIGIAPYGRLGADAGASQKTSTATAASRPTFDELYAQGQLANKGIKTLAAQFVETTTNALLREDRPIVARGMLYVERPSRVAMQYTDPPDQRIVIAGKWMTTMTRGVRQRLDIGAAQDRVQKYFVGSDAGELRRIFDIELLDRSSRPGTREVVMVPKRKQIKEALSKLELWVGEKSALLEAMRLTFANGDTKLMEFENVVPNAAIDPAVFTAP
jgi:outer membrane lipoprotein-sorting protein